MVRKLAPTLAPTFAAMLLAGVATNALAQDFKGKSAGDILVRARVIGVLPDGKNTVTTAAGADAGLRTDVDNAYVPEVDFSYFLTENIALELIAATTKHDVKGKGAPDVDLGHVWLLPPTLTLQYHFLPKAQFSPYVGAGLNYTFFYGTSNGAVNSVKYENGLGYALQAGVDVALGGPWSLNLDVKRLWLSTDVKVNGGALKSTVDLDPWIVGVGIGYRF